MTARQALHQRPSLLRSVRSSCTAQSCLCGQTFQEPAAPLAFDLREVSGRRWALSAADVPYYLFRRLSHKQTPELQRNLITNPGCGQNLALSQKKKGNLNHNVLFVSRWLEAPHCQASEHNADS